jgi:hypothetical protein
MYSSLLFGSLFSFFIYLRTTTTTTSGMGITTTNNCTDDTMYFNPQQTACDLSCSKDYPVPPALVQGQTNITGWLGARRTSSDPTKCECWYGSDLYVSELNCDKLNEGTSSSCVCTPRKVGCFPSIATVLTLNNRNNSNPIVRSMVDLRIGTHVLVDPIQNRYEPILFMTDHWHSKTGGIILDSSDVMADFLLISMSSSLLHHHISISSKLMLTPDHLVLILMENGHHDFQSIPAYQVHIGHLFLHSTGEILQVNDIQRVSEFGLYSPVTVSGQIVVNNILVSCFTHATPSKHVVKPSLVLLSVLQQILPNFIYETIIVGHYGLVNQIIWVWLNCFYDSSSK